ncbi:MAG: hypothetical protein IT440_10925 [Phycisphaeraceae bacterium]|nr:hypothetical protein [Phycisphaeraceae bacterium]
MTLIEVLAALVLLGSLLAATTLAEGRFARRWRDGLRRLHAIRMTDQWLTQWADNWDAFPTDDEGTFADDADLAWRTTRVESPDAALPGLNIVQLTVTDHRDADAPTVVLEMSLAATAPPATTQPDNSPPDSQPSS